VSTHEHDTKEDVAYWEGRAESAKEFQALTAERDELARKLAEAERENERIKHEAIRMAAHTPPTFEAEYVKLQAKLAAVREAMGRVRAGLSALSYLTTSEAVAKMADEITAAIAEAVKES
jgi:hypothetical protein